MRARFIVALCAALVTVALGAVPSTASANTRLLTPTGTLVSVGTQVKFTAEDFRLETSLTTVTCKTVGISGEVVKNSLNPAYNAVIKPSANGFGEGCQWSSFSEKHPVEMPHFDMGSAVEFQDKRVTSVEVDVETTWPSLGFAKCNVEGVPSTRKWWAISPWKPTAMLNIAGLLPGDAESFCEQANVSGNFFLTAQTGANIKIQGIE
jgi:hypothetical protein